MMSEEFGRVQKQAGNSSGPEQLGQLSQHSLNILIAEDDVLTHRLLQIILRDTGHALKFVSNGIEAVQMVKSGEFDLILMDVLMPLMDGMEATRQIRAWENGRKHIAIVGVTAIKDSAYRSCMQAGMDDVTSKPFDINHIHEILAACVNQKLPAENKTSSAAADQSAGLTVLDVQAAIKRFAGDQETYTKLLDEFVLSLSFRFEELLNYAKAGNWQDLSNRAHNLKGLSANFGAMELSRKAFKLDQCINEDQYGQVQQKLDEIQVSMQNLRTEAMIFLGNLPNHKDELTF